MNVAALLFALIGFVVTLGSLVLYFRTIPRGTVPKEIGGFATQLVVGVGVSTVGVFLGITGDGWAGALVYIPAGLAIVLGLFILWVLSQRKTPVGDITVKVGDALLPFAATTSGGEPFDSNELKGTRVLLKFFRGGWCPYCSAELSAFNSMLTELADRGVTVIALSKDPVAEAALHKARDGLEFTLLSDPDLAVIRTFGVEHHKALGQTSVPKSNLGGIPIGFAPFNFSAMAIPTTLLIDEDGVIRWIDQTDDYRLRSSNERVMAAVAEAFAAEKGASA